MTCLQWVVRFGLARSWTSTSRHRPAKSRCSGEHILVLETSTPEDAKDKQISWVTLAVKPSSVSDLIAASAKGTIHFVLPGNSAASQAG